MTQDSEPSSTANPDTIKAALATRRIAVVGMSANELRASNYVGYYMMRHGYEVIPVNPRETEIYGLTCYPSLLDVPDDIDVVDVFRDPSAVPAIATEAVAKNAKFLWLQFGVISPEGVAIAAAAGIPSVVDRCIKIEHARYLGRMHTLGFNTGQIDSQRRTPS